MKEVAEPDGRLQDNFPLGCSGSCPPRLCVSLRNIVDEEFLRKGHVFLGFSKCGRFVLSYTSDVLDDDFAFYSYHLYWWQFQVHSKLRLVRQVRLFQDEEIYSDLYLTVCEWPSDNSKVIVFGFNTSGNGMLMNMMSDENHRDIYISTVSAPPTSPCTDCRESPKGPCLLHSFMLHTKYQVVYPFPTFQPAFQLKKDHVVLLNTSFSLVACAISVHPAGNSCDSFLAAVTHLFQGPVHACFLLFKEIKNPIKFCTANKANTMPVPAAPCLSALVSLPPGGTLLFPLNPAPPPLRELHQPSPGPGNSWLVYSVEPGRHLDWRPKTKENGPDQASKVPSQPSDPDSPTWHRTINEGHHRSSGHTEEPNYVNYTQLRYVLGEVTETDQESEYEDDKISLPFLVTDLKGQHLKPLNDKASFKVQTVSPVPFIPFLPFLTLSPRSLVTQGQHLIVEQLTLDFEYVINEVIRHDASWYRQFCSFSDYDIVILEMCPETNQVIMNIGLLLLAFPAPQEEAQLRPKTYHTSLKVAWDLHTGVFSTLSVGELTEVKGQTSGSVWSSYRKSCVDTVMKWLVPENNARYVNRMTNEALHKGCSLKVLADSVRYTWIVL
ncbi:unnamed protein product [Ranitomeya imitator]|uniref:DDB1- and CUL4-associated factor 15 WD40 repeat-containing domain-containing protein n=1 Tax=Ranitomeya imitator TaxID=111125 RepID=A0ABN9LGA6_9NEOB|nr:unnamed protein product [Ranitomeya imitator]